MIPVRFCTDFCVDSESAIKTRFKAFFDKMSQSALNQVLTLPDYRTQKMLQIPLKIIDLQNDSNISVAKQLKFRNSVPMSYFRLFENTAKK